MQSVNSLIFSKLNPLQSVDMLPMDEDCTVHGALTQTTSHRPLPSSQTVAVALPCPQNPQAWKHSRVKM